MKEKLANLIDVKSIITFIITILFFILSLMGLIESNAVVDVCKMVFIFYFGTQVGKAINTDVK